MTKFIKNDKVRFIGNQRDFNDNVTTGNIYEIDEVDESSDALFYGDTGKAGNRSYISSETEHLFELVTEESPRTESDLIANLALRVSKAEKRVAHDRHNAMLDFEQIYAELRELKSRNPHTEYYGTPVGNEVGAVEQTQAERIEAVCTEVSALLIRKNHDYGDSFSKQYAKYGVLSGLIRMDDKMRRLETLIGGVEAEVDESIEDSIADLAGYALLTLVEVRKGRKNE